MADYPCTTWAQVKTALAAVASVDDTISLSVGGDYSTDAEDLAINASFTMNGRQSTIDGGDAGSLIITGGTQIWNDCEFLSSSGSALAITGATAECDITLNTCIFQSSAAHGLSANASGANNVTVAANDCTASDNTNAGFAAGASSSGDVELTCTDCISDSNGTDGYTCTTTALQTGACALVLTGCTATDNGTGVNDESITGHLSADITATDCTFSGAVGNEFRVGAAADGAYTFTNCTFTGKDTAATSCFIGDASIVCTLTNCTITNANAAEETFSVTGGTYTLTNCTLAGPSLYAVVCAGGSTVSMINTNVGNTSGSGILIYGGTSATLTIRGGVIRHSSTGTSKQLVYAYPGVVNIIDSVIYNDTCQSICMVRNSGSLNITGSHIIVNIGTLRVASSALFRMYDVGTLRLSRNLLNLIGTNATASTSIYIVDGTPESGTTPPLIECVGNVFDIPTLSVPATQKWYAGLGGTYSSGVFSGNEIYGDGTAMNGFKTSAANVVLTGNIFHNLLVGVTVTNDNQYGTIAGSGANIFSSCGTNVSGGTPVLASGDLAINYGLAGRRNNDKSFSNAHKRIGGGI